MSDPATKGQEFLKKGQKALKSWGFMGNKYEDAAENFEKAANNFKLAKCWADAADAYQQLADVQKKLDSKHEVANAYVEAAKCAGKIPASSSKAASLNPTTFLNKAVELYTDMGRLGMAARQLKEIAEVKEKEGSKEESITFYEQAAELFATENSNSEATKCRLKVAELSAELQQYGKAAGIYEDAARAAVDNNLLKFSAKGYLLNAGICSLCYLSPDDLDITISKYKDIDFNFDSSRECVLLEKLCGSLASADEKAFTIALTEYDSMTKLDPWRTRLLLAAKRRLQDRINGPEDDDDEGDIL